MKTCTTCRYFVPDQELPEAGDCRRYPPVVDFTVKPDDGSQFPVVMMTDWCGEYRAKETE